MMKKITLLFALLTFSLGYSQTDIAVNGGFESGDFTGWTQFASGTQAIINTNPSVGTYCAELNNNVAGSNSVIKNANVGVGTAVGGQEVTITFDARGTTANGGVAFAELFSEISGGGVSKTQLLGGAPLALDADANTWKSFSFVTTLGPDVSGGVTLQLTATTGATAGSIAQLFYDNVKITLTDVGPTARVQVIHNSADAAASVVDVYLDGALALDNFAFRTASPFIDVPAGTPISVAVAPSNSTSVADAIATFPYTLADGETYVLVAEGIVSPSGYVPATAFDIAVYAMGQEAAATTGNTDVLVHHGSTDAPTVDVNEVSGPSVLVDNISYGEFDGYLELPTADYNINISTADGSTVVASYDAPLATLGLDDAAIVVVASGFLDPSVNSNGPAFGLWVALPAGGALVELPITGSAPTAPTVAAPIPSPLQSEVINMYSNTYTTDVTVSSWKSGWSVAGAYTNDVLVAGAGSEAKRYENVDFVGVEFYAPNAVDATAMNFFHLDVWTANASTFRVKLVDLGSGTVEGEIAFAGIAQGQWVSLDIPLADFADPSKVTNPANLLTVRNSLQQLIFSGLPVGAFEFYVDNIYFSSVASLGTKNFEIAGLNVYPNPTQDSWTVKTKNIKMSSIQVFDILGKQVLSLKPEATEAIIDASVLKSGLYFAKINTANGSSSLKLVRQ